MIVYAWKSWRRLAWPALLFWILAVYLLGSALQTGRSLSREKNQPCRLTVSAGEGLDLEVAAQLEGVTACTWVYVVSARVTAAGYTGDLTVYGVDSSFVEGELISGALYPQSGGMACLVVNEAALRSLTRGELENLTEVDWFTSQTLLGETPVKLCGILRDGREEPLAYMSQSAARDYLVRSKGTASPTQVWIDLENAGAAEPVTQALAQAGYPVQGEEHSDWTVQETRLRWQTFSVAVSTLAAAALLVQTLRAEEKREKHTGVNGLRVLIFTVWGSLLGLLLLGVKGLLSA